MKLYETICSRRDVQEFLCDDMPSAARLEERPMLEKIGWQSRLPLGAMAYGERWEQTWSDCACTSTTLASDESDVREELP